MYGDIHLVQDFFYSHTYLWSMALPLKYLHEHAKQNTDELSI